MHQPDGSISENVPAEESTSCIPPRDGCTRRWVSSSEVAAAPLPARNCHTDHRPEATMGSYPTPTVVRPAAMRSWRGALTLNRRSPPAASQWQLGIARPRIACAIFARPSPEQPETIAAQPRQQSRSGRVELRLTGPEPGRARKLFASRCEAPGGRSKTNLQG